MKYSNLDVEAFKYQNDDGGESFSVRVAASPAGEQKIADAEPVVLSSELRTRLKLLDKRDLEIESIIALGEELGAALFPPRARLFLTRSLERLGEQEGLRIRLKLDTLSLVDLPWEFVYIANPDTPSGQKGPEGFLVLNRRLSLVRYEVIGQAQAQLSPLKDHSIRVVGVTANPVGTPPLDLDGERKILDEALKGVGNVEADFFENATVDDLINAFASDAHVFHYAGHGKFESTMGVSFGSVEGRGYLSLVGDDGREAPFYSDRLALLMMQRNVRLAVLGACEGGRRDGVNAWTGVVPALALAGIPAVIGMQMTIRDKNAITFTRRLYRALAGGQTVDEAVSEGRLAVFSRSTDSKERDWAVPVLYLRATEGVLFPVAAAAGSAAQPGGPSAGGGAAAKVATEKVDTRALRVAMVSAFSNEELDALCFDLQEELKANSIFNEPISLEMVGGSSKNAMVLNLIQFCERRALLPHLVRAVRSARPGIV